MSVTTVAIAGFAGTAGAAAAASVWAPQTSPTANWNSVAFGDTSNGWVVGGNGAIAHTTDGGATWSSQTSGAPGSTLRGVASTDANNAWAVGDPGTNNPIILHTADGGANWTAQTLAGSMTSLGGTFILTSVAFADASHGWAVGSSGTIIHTTDGGANWSPQTDSDPGQYDLGGVAFTDASNGWAVGKNGTVIHTTNGGSTWTLQAQANPTTEELFSVSFSDPLNGWAVGRHDTIIHTTNGGNTWTLENPGTSGVLFLHVAFVDAQHGWAVGSNGTILATADGGATWTSQIASNADQNFAGVAFPDASHGWVVGAGSAILTYSPSSQTASCPNSEGAFSCSVSVLGTSFETRMAVGSSQTSGTLSISQDAPAAISCAGVPLAEDGDTWSFGSNSPIQSLTVHEHFSDNSGTGNFCYASFVPFLPKLGTLLSLQMVNGRLQFVGALPRCALSIPGLLFPLVPPCIDSSSASDIVASILIDAHGRG